MEAEELHQAIREHNRREMEKAMEFREPEESIIEMVVTVYLELCKGCRDIYIPEDESHCDGCIEHVESIPHEEAIGGSD